MTNPLILTAGLMLAASIAHADGPTSYQIGGDSYKGYFAAAEAPRGTIVVLPTWNGLSDYEMDRARMLAQLGYDAFAADLYIDGTQPKTMESRQAGLQALLADRTRMHDLASAAIAEARLHGSGPLIVMGYSMGGIVAMELAWSGLSNTLDVHGHVIFSGRVSDAAGRLMPDDIAPFFVAHGEQDTMIQSSGIESFVDDVELAGGRAEIHIYPGMGHLFSAFGFPNYNKSADLDSWAKLQNFLNDISG